MKKFSGMTNQKVGKEPERTEKKIGNEDLFAHMIMGLIDEHLVIQTYGPVDRYLRAGTLKIHGKEALADAIISALGEKSIKDATAALESLKLKSSDWAAIDEKIQEISAKDRASELDRDHISISHMVDLFGDDKESLKECASKYAARIKTKEAAMRKKAAAEKMFQEGHIDKDQMVAITEAYTERAESLSSKK
jgi:hypothetical protein